MLSGIDNLYVLCFDFEEVLCKEGGVKSGSKSGRSLRAYCGYVSERFLGRFHWVYVHCFAGRVLLVIPWFGQGFSLGSGGGDSGGNAALVHPGEVESKYGTE